MMERKFIVAFSLLLIGCSTEVNTGWTRFPDWVIIPGGTFVFGSNDGEEDQRPELVMSIDSFYLSATEITNRQFERFVEETNYITSAERNGGGMVYIDEWSFVEEANWKHPLGAKSSIDSLMDHPVVLVSHKDALAYCEWAGAYLPTEVEWEFAATSGRALLGNKNTWTGSFPFNNTQTDGFLYTAPVDQYSPDSLGCYNLLGNVWEWCADSYNYEIHDKWFLKETIEQSVYLGRSFDPRKASLDDTLRVIKGGSFMCHASYCKGYIPTSRQSAEENEAYFHIGFRVAKALK